MTYHIDIIRQLNIKGLQMKQITTILLTGTAAIFLSACGGGGSSSGGGTPPVDPMTLRDGIMISYHYPAELCESDTLRNELELQVPEAYNWLIRVESNSVNCGTYGKTESVSETGGCMTIDIADYDPDALQYNTSCVVGFDLDTATAWSTAREDIALEMSFALDTVE